MFHIFHSFSLITVKYNLRFHTRLGVKSSQAYIEKSSNQFHLTELHEDINVLRNMILQRQNWKMQRKYMRDWIITI